VPVVQVYQAHDAIVFDFYGLHGRHVPHGNKTAFWTTAAST
jgi:hypothetical protein